MKVNETLDFYLDLADFAIVIAAAIVVVHAAAPTAETVAGDGEMDGTMDGVEDMVGVGIIIIIIDFNKLLLLIKFYVLHATFTNIFYCKTRNRYITT